MTQQDSGARWSQCRPGKLTCDPFIVPVSRTGSWSPPCQVDVKRPLLTFAGLDRGLMPYHLPAASAVSSAIRKMEPGRPLLLRQVPIPRAGSTGTPNGCS